MILAEKTTQVSGDLVFDQEVKMKIDDAASALIIRTLTNLYSAPYVAVLREYASNAYDSHLRAGQTRPVEISLPNGLSPNLVVEDYGVGLSHEELIAFGQYGSTTKNKTNDEIGGFGLGSKSGLAIASQFTVQAVKDGKKNTVVIGFDESSAPTMKMFPETETDQENGVKITIPTNEIRKFRDAVDSDIFLGWKPGSILVNGKAPRFSVHDTDVFTPIEKLGWMRTGQNNRWFVGDYYTGRALVGPIEYRIRWNELNLLNSNLRTNYFSDIVVNLPIGSVDLVPSREDLRYTARTKNAIQAAIQAIIDRASVTYQAAIDAAPSYREALQESLKASQSGFGDVTYTYKGKPTSPKATDANDGSTAVTRAYAAQERRNGGYIYTKNQGFYSLHEPSHLLTQILRDADPILVVNSPVGAGNGPFAIQAASTYVTNYTRGLPNNDDLSQGAPKMYFTSYDLKDLDPVIASAFATIMPASEVIELAESTRKARLRAARANKKTVKPDIKELPVRLWNFRNGGVGWYTESKLENLNTSVSYILLKTDADRMSNNFRRVLTSKVGWNENSRIRELLSDLAGTGRQYQFLIANKTWDTESYKKILPNLYTPMQAITREVKKSIKELSPEQVRAVLDRENRQYQWAQYFSTHSSAFSNIESEETRNWIKAMQDSTATKQYNFLKQVSGLSDSLGIPRKNLELPAASQDSPGARYPLLTEMYSIKHLEAAVFYMNAVDSQV